MGAKKQHKGSHSRRSYPVKQGLPKETTKFYKEKALIIDGKLINEEGKVKEIPRKLKKGLKDVKKFINKKRRGFLKQEIKNIDNNETN